MLDPETLPLPVDLPFVPRVFYVVLPNGALSRITAGDGLDPVLADGVKVVTQEVWEGLQAQMHQAHDARVAELEAAEEETRRQQYEDLRGVGMPEATARSLSGYTGQASANGAE